MTVETFLFWLAVAAVSVLSAARLTRLVTQDIYPPVRAVREWYIRGVIHAHRRHPRIDLNWAELVKCPYCAAPYITLGVLGWGALADWDTAWWFINGVLAACYAAASYVVRDGE